MLNRRFESDDAKYLYNTHAVWFGKGKESV